MKRLACAVAALAALSILGCGSSDTDAGQVDAEPQPAATVPIDATETATAEIEEAMQQFADAFAAKDAEAVCSLMSPQAVKETEQQGDAPCEEVVPLGFALVGQEEIDRISNPQSIQINGDRAVVNYEYGDDGYADLVDGKWMVGQ